MAEGFDQGLILWSDRILSNFGDATLALDVTTYDDMDYLKRKIYKMHAIRNAL